MISKKIDLVIREVPDFPKRGINFKDITTLLLDQELSSEIIDTFINRLKGKKVDAIVGVESRGFLFGFLLANKMGIPFIPIRKSGKLPGETLRCKYDLEYGSAEVEVHKSDIILLGVSRTSKTPTSIYLANKGFKTSNIPLVNENSLPETLKKNPKMACVVGLSTEPERLADLRKNRMNSLRETENTQYIDLENIKKEVLDAKKTFQKYKWPLIDVTRKSVEETAASIIKIHEIYLNNAR